jgi:cytosolic phospholipase A2
MSNNIPFYPLLRRDVDIVIALDTSAHIQTTPWFERADGTSTFNPSDSGYARQKGIIGWPVGVGWPKDTSPSKNIETLTKAEPTTPEDAQLKLKAAKSQPMPDQPTDPITQKYGLGHCNIWIGNKAERTDPNEPPKAKVLPLTIDDSWQMDPDDGIMLIYLPLLPNLKCPGVIPETTEYMSTWNFQYTPEQIDNVVQLAERNFEEGEERIKRAVRAVWTRKKELRRQKEREEGILEKAKE